jgi:hypothetical protein
MLQMGATGSVTQYSQYKYDLLPQLSTGYSTHVWKSRFFRNRAENALNTERSTGPRGKFTGKRTAPGYDEPEDSTRTVSQQKTRAGSAWCVICNLPLGQFSVLIQ